MLKFNNLTLNFKPMPGNQRNTSNKPYLRIVGGNLAQTVDKDTPNAKLREYELSNGDKGSKWELNYMNWTGKVQRIEFKDNEYGTTCNIDLGDAVLTLNTDSRYFSDLATKLCGADLKQEITFHPFDIEIEGGKRKRGVSVQQNGEKLKNYFYNYETKESLYGFPTVDKEQQAKLKKNYWKVYFAEVTAFLVEKLENLEIPNSKPAQELDDGAPLPTEEFLPDDSIPQDLPF